MIFKGRMLTKGQDYDLRIKWGETVFMIGGAMGSITTFVILVFDISALYSRDIFGRNRGRVFRGFCR